MARKLTVTHNGQLVGTLRPRQRAAQYVRRGTFGKLGWINQMSIAALEALPVEQS